MSYRLLYVLAYLCFGQAIATGTAFALLLLMGGNGLVPAIFTLVGLFCSVSFLGLAKKQKALYGSPASKLLENTLPPKLQTGLDAGTLSEEEYDEVLEITNRWTRKPHE